VSSSHICSLATPVLRVVFDWAELAVRSLCTSGSCRLLCFGGIDSFYGCLIPSRADIHSAPSIPTTTSKFRILKTTTIGELEDSIYSFAHVNKFNTKEWYIIRNQRPLERLDMCRFTGCSRGKQNMAVHLATFPTVSPYHWCRRSHLQIRCA
jgi:hypothetical protein